MAKVKVLESCAGLDFSYVAGEEVEADKHTQSLINAGLAVWVGDKQTETTKKGATKKDK